MHEWKVPSVECSLFGGGPRTFQDKEPGFFLFLLRFVRFFVQTFCLICTVDKNVITVRAHGEMPNSKVKEIMHLQKCILRDYCIK